MKLALKIILPILAIVIGVITAKTIVQSRPAQQKESRENIGTLVELSRINQVSQNSEIVARGTIEPAQRITLASQVGGQILGLHPSLVPGGMIKKGERLVQIDSRDYNMLAQEQQARLEASEQEVLLEQGRSAVAQKEWELMGNQLDIEISEEAKSRALRAPQLKAIKANQKATQSALQRAQLNISRSRLVAPFNLVVLNENVDVGQVIAPNLSIATLVGTDAFWVTVPLPSAELKWLQIPTQEGEKGSPAIIRYDTGDEIIEKKGYLVRRLSEIDPIGKMVKVVVEIPDPLSLNHPQESALLLGSQVEVIFEGKALENVIALPRKSLRGENQAWVFKKSQFTTSESSTSDLNTKKSMKPASALTGILEIRDLQIIRKTRDFVFVKEGLSADDLIISSRIPVPISGLKLRSNQQGF